MKNLRNFIQTTLVVSSLLLFSSFVKAQTPSEWEKLKEKIEQIQFSFIYYLEDPLP